MATPLTCQTNIFMAVWVCSYFLIKLMIVSMNVSGDFEVGDF